MAPEYYFKLPKKNVYCLTLKALPLDEIEIQLLGS
jgi:hypothetical protein